VDAEILKKLLNKSGELLSRRAFSRAELRQKLATLADETHVESVLDRLEEQNLLNDADYAYNFALNRIRFKGWGPSKVRASLLQRQVAPQIVEAELSKVENELIGERPLMEYMRKYCGSHWPPTNPRDIQKLILHLRRRGFDKERILDALREKIPAASLQPFETGE